MPRFLTYPHPNGVLVGASDGDELFIIQPRDLALNDERGLLALLDRKLSEYGYLASEAELWQLLVAVESNMGRTP